MKFPKFHESKPPKPFDENNLLLPQPIRERIAHNAGEAESRQLATLFMPGHRQQRFGFYLLMKAAAEDDTLQKTLLQELAARSYDFATLDDNYAAPGLAYLARQSKPTVEANKLAQISMYGIGNWRDWCDRKVSEQSDKGELFVLAHATLIGFDAIAKHTLQEGKRVHLLKPNRFNATDLPVGYTMEPTGVSEAPLRITDLAADFERPATGILFDDTSRTGAAREAALEFWTRTGAPEPQFVAATNITRPAAVLT